MGIPRIRRTDISIGDDGNGNSGIQEGFHRSRCHSDQSRERLSSELQTPRLYRVHSSCTTSIFRLKQEKPRYCSAMRSAIPGLPDDIQFYAAASFHGCGCSLPQSKSFAHFFARESWTKSAKHQCFQGFLTLLLL